MIRITPYQISLTQQSNPSLGGWGVGEGFLLIFLVTQKALPNLGSMIPLFINVWKWAGSMFTGLLHNFYKILSFSFKNTNVKMKSGITLSVN